VKLIVGLGNPGAQYDKTRHNAGFMVVDRLAGRHASGGFPRARFHAVTLDATIAGQQCLLLKPTTYMNLSGRCVSEAIRFYKLTPAEDLLVLVDDVALPVGALRVRASGSAGGHNGLADIDRMLAGEPYPRIRVGVGAVPQFMAMADWVLSRFTKEETDALEAALRDAVLAVECVVQHGISTAMNQFNRKVASDDGPPRREASN
jgi:PTH1 family peptidyl-tRNA hydrolase